MCGIIGINEQNEGLVRRAGETFAYRGPDATAFFSDALVTFGHHRLSILDLDPRSTQPMADASEKLRIVFNGEIYNFKEVKARLVGKYNFRTTSDTEVLLYAYKEWGKDMTQHIEGMFALAIYDSEKKKVLLLRDHAGIKPLYYYAEGGVFAFASEQKGLVRALREKGIELEFDRRSLDLYFAFGYIPNPRSLYRGICKLPKSSYLEYDLTSRKVAAEGTYESEYERVATEEEYMKLIEKKILAHLVSDVPVGVFFSGGTDSTLIAAVLHRHNIDLETFSIKLDYKTEDAKYFTLISEHLKLKSHVYDFNAVELDSIYEEVMSKMDEPTFDNSIFPTYFVSKKAAEKVKVVLSGEGGDEYFFGYPRTKELSLMKGPRDFTLTLLDYLFLLSPAFKAKNHLFQKLFRVFKRPMSYYLLSMSPSRDLASVGQWKAAKEALRSKDVRPTEIDQELYLEDDLLRKTDFATSYASIEGRVPLLDADIVRNSKLFEGSMLEGGVLKAFLKKMLATYIPKELVYRSKSGFGVDIKKFFVESASLRADLLKALQFFKDRQIEVPHIRNIEKAMSKHPHLCFALVSLYRSIANNEQI